MFTAGIGYKFAKYLPWKPVLWVYYDWASGDGNPTDGKRGTFNQLFPLAHAYFGYIDLVGRQNIQDVSAKLVAKPHKIVTAILAYHNFRLDDPRDALYNAGGGAIRRDASGASGTHVGDEVDLVLKVRVTPRVSWLAGYSRFFAGDFVDRTNPAGVSGNASFFYTQLGVKF